MRLIDAELWQVKGIGFNENYFPMVTNAPKKCLCALAIKSKFNVYQMLVAVAYLYGDIDQEI